MTNIVTIDPSLTSTAFAINGSPYSLAAEKLVLTKKQQLTKWFELCDPHCDIHPVNTDYKNEKDYAKLEIAKLQTYQKIANLIRYEVDTYCKPQYNTICLIEGYSYSSAAGPLIDLVTLGTLIRSKLFSRTNTELVVLSPSTVKRLAAKLTYPPIQKGKKVEYRNNQGVAGGSFKKPDIYKVLTENQSLQTEWVKFLRNIEQETLSQKSIPKPIEDINDAIVMYHIADAALRDNNDDFIKTVKSLREN